MLTSLIVSGRQQIVEAGRRSALGLVGVLAMLPGLALLTHAGWALLAAAHGPALASLLMGTLWIGIGLVFLGMAAYGRVRPPPAPPVINRLALIEAFLTGFSAARKGR